MLHAYKQTKSGENSGGGRHNNRFVTHPRFYVDLRIVGCSLLRISICITVEIMSKSHHHRRCNERRISRCGGQLM